MHAPPTVGALIRDARLRAGLTRTELAVKLHRSEQTVIAWERGRRHPSPVTLRKIAAVLQVSLGELLDEVQVAS